MNFIDQVLSDLAKQFLLQVNVFEINFNYIQCSMQNCKSKSIDFMFVLEKIKTKYQGSVRTIANITNKILFSNDIFYLCFQLRCYMCAYLLVIFNLENKLTYSSVHVKI